MLFSDMGAEVIRIDRKGGRSPAKTEIYMRGRKAVALDMKKPEGVEAALKLIDRADALIEGLPARRHGATGRGPDVCLKRNPKLVYGRMTGWGADGPRSPTPPATISITSRSPVRCTRSTEGRKAPASAEPRG